MDNIYFSTLSNWFTYSSSVYLDKAIHKESHPEHALLLDEIQKIDMHDAQIELGYFRNLSNPENNETSWLGKIKHWFNVF